MPNVVIIKSYFYDFTIPSVKNQQKAYNICRIMSKSVDKFRAKTSLKFHSKKIFVNIY